MNKKKKIITAILVLLVILLGGASVYVATQLSTRKAVAPTAPESKPKAFETCGAGLSCDSIQATGSTQCTDSLNPGDRYCCPLGQVISNGACVDEWQGCDACTVTASASAVICVPSGVVTCTPDCPTACGTAASTITTCTNNCGSTTKACAATAACPGDGDWSEWGDCSATACGTSGTKTRTCNNPAPEVGGAECTKANGTKTTATARTETAACNAIVCVVLEGSKTTYKNVTSNTSGSYSLTTVAETISKSQIYVYTIELKNTSTATASGVVIKDSLANMPVTYMDAVTGCSYSASSLELTCNTSIKPSETKKFSFRVKASDSVANGTEISNTAKVTYPDGSLDLSKNSAVSTVVGCNHTCTTAEECSTGLTCDTTTSKCRVSACLTEDDCTCTVAVVPTVTRAVTRTSAVTATSTIAPTKTIAPTRITTQTEEVIAEATPTILPETGIFDLPGIAAFGGGLLLAVIGILLAL